MDNDPALLHAAPQALHRWACDRAWVPRLDRADLVLARPAGEIVVTFALGDLARQGLGDDAEFAGVTGSALLDLTSSAAWLDSLAAACGGRPLLMALSFDGRLAFEPAAPEDEEVCRRFPAHHGPTRASGPRSGLEPRIISQIN